MTSTNTLRVFSLSLFLVVICIGPCVVVADCSVDNTTCLVDSTHFTVGGTLSSTTAQVPGFETTITLTAAENVVLVSYTWTRNFNVGPSSTHADLYIWSQLRVNGAETTESKAARCTYGRLNDYTLSGAGVLELGPGTYTFSVWYGVKSGQSVSFNVDADRRNHFIQAVLLDGQVLHNERRATDFDIVDNLVSSYMPSDQFQPSFTLTEKTTMLVNGRFAVHQRDGTSNSFEAFLHFNGVRDNAASSVFGSAVYVSTTHFLVRDFEPGTYEVSVNYRSNSGDDSYYDASQPWATMSLAIVKLNPATNTMLAQNLDLSSGALIGDNSWHPYFTETILLTRASYIMSECRYTGSTNDRSGQPHVPGLQTNRLTLDGAEVAESLLAAGSPSHATIEAYPVLQLAPGEHTIVYEYKADTPITLIAGGSWSSRMLYIADLGPVCLPDDQVTAELCDTEPPVPEYEYAITGANFQFTINASTLYDASFTVEFPDSLSSKLCDFDINVQDNDKWTITALDKVNGQCQNQYTLNIPVATMLSDCGFTQRDSSTEVSFVNSPVIKTNRSCIGLRDERVHVTRQNQLSMVITSQKTVSASTSGLEVFGAAVSLELLGDLTITPDIDTSIATVSGQFVTSVQHPYELQFESASLSDELDSDTFGASSARCTANNATRLPCQQKWDFSVDVAIQCNDKTTLDNDVVNVTFRVNCSENFIGECAPDFAEDVVVSFSLNSPNYCPQADQINLLGELKTYAFDADGTADFGATSLDALPSGNFVDESLFTIDATVYAEFVVSVVGSAARLTSTGLVRIETIPSIAEQPRVVLYDTTDNTQIQSVQIYNDSFGSANVGDYPDYRARFSFTWLDNVTIHLDDTIEESQAVSIAATVVSDFTNTQRIAPVEGHPVLERMVEQEFGQSQRTVVHLMADADGNRGSAGFALASIQRASSPGGQTDPATSSDDSSVLAGLGTSGIAAVVACIAVVALVVVAVYRRTYVEAGTEEANKTTVDMQSIRLSTLPQSSSFATTNGVQSAPMTTELGNDLQSTAFAYATSDFQNIQQ
jgi:hypothetical protein